MNDIFLYKRQWWWNIFFASTSETARTRTKGHVGIPNFAAASVSPSVIHAQQTFSRAADVIGWVELHASFCLHNLNSILWRLSGQFPWQWDLHGNGSRMKTSRSLIWGQTPTWIPDVRKLPALISPQNGGLIIWPPSVRPYVRTYVRPSVDSDFSEVYGSTGLKL